MFELLYTSVSPQGLDEDELIKIVMDAQRRNAELGVTGILAYCDREIMQIIEGDKDVILTLFEKIKSDPRHTLVNVFYQGEVAKRSFSDWTMESLMLDKQQANQLFRTKLPSSSTPISDLCQESPSRGKKTFLSLRDTLYSKLL